jgi:hypothetical protein
MESREALFADVSNLDEALLAELRSRRERLKQLIRLINAEVRVRAARSGIARPRCRKRTA